MKKSTIAFLYLIAFFGNKIFAQTTISANTANLCAGQAITLIAYNQYMTDYSGCVWQKDGIDINGASGTSTYNPLAAGEYHLKCDASATLGNWKRLLTLDNIYAFEDTYFLNSQAGWATGGGEIIRTIDGGNSWLKHNGAFPGTHYSVWFNNATTGYAAGFGLWTSTDGGATWAQQALPNYIGYELYDIRFVNATTGWIVGRKNKLYITTNSGTTWTEQNANLPDPDWSLYSVFFTNTTTGWIAGERDVIKKTTNGGTTWVSQTLPSGTSLRTIYDVFFLDANKGWLVGGTGDAHGVIFTTSNSGTTWTAQTNPGSSTQINKVTFLDANNGWAVGNSDILKTTNGGATWTVSPNLSLSGKAVFLRMLIMAGLAAAASSNICQRIM